MNPALEVIVILLKLFYYYMHATFRKIVPVEPKNIDGKLVLITGAGMGIGRCMAQRFAQHGARLALWDINQKGVEETAADIRERGGDARAYVCDVTKKDNVAEVAAKTKQEMGDVDILCNNAGIMVCKDILDLTETDIRRTMDVNTISHFWTLQEFLPYMIEKNKGHIVTTASMSGRHGAPMLTDYTASKFAVMGLVESLEAEMNRHGKDGIKFTTICPMGVQTNLLSSIEHRAVFKDRMNPIMSPEEIAEGVVDGVLREKHLIFFPDKMKNTHLLKEIVPRKASVMIAKFFDAGFHPTVKAQ